MNLTRNSTSEQCIILRSSIKLSMNVEKTSGITCPVTTISREATKFARIINLIELSREEYLDAMKQQRIILLANKLPASHEPLPKKTFRSFVSIRSEKQTENKQASRKQNTNGQTKKKRRPGAVRENESSENDSTIANSRRTGEGGLEWLADDRAERLPVRVLIRARSVEH